MRRDARDARRSPVKAAREPLRAKPVPQNEEPAPQCQAPPPPAPAPAPAPPPAPLELTPLERAVCRPIRGAAVAARALDAGAPPRSIREARLHFELRDARDERIDARLLTLRKARAARLRIMLSEKTGLAPRAWAPPRPRPLPPRRPPARPPNPFPR